MGDACGAGGDGHDPLAQALARALCCGTGGSAACKHAGRIIKRLAQAAALDGGVHEAGGIGGGICIVMGAGIPHDQQLPGLRGGIGRMQPDHTAAGAHFHGQGTLSGRMAQGFGGQQRFGVVPGGCDHHKKRVHESS